MKRLLVVLVVAGLLSACSHHLTLQSADGSVGMGTASAGMGAGSITVTIDGRRYEGRWTAVTEATSSFATLVGPRGQMASAAGSSIGGSRGMALLQATEGAGALRCAFVFSGMTRSGYGGCADATGKHYDLLIG